jgi:signal transduction histidine kinase
VVALAAGTAVSATIGALSLWLGQVITSDSVVDVWRTWWLGDTCGALVIVPLAIDWYPVTKPRLERTRVVEATLLIAAVAGLSMLALDTRQLTYLVFPGLIWAAVRFNERGATLAVAIVVGFTMWTIAHYIGPFGSAPLASNVLRVQLFIAVIALSTLYLAAVVSERQALTEQLRTSRARLTKVAATERRRLEHNLHDGAQQRLTALAVRLGIASGDVHEDPDRAAAALDQAQAELSIAIQELRELARGIHPTVLTRLGLAGAIESVAESSGLRIELLELPANGADRAAEVTAYYVVAEAITNAQKHAHASSLRVRAAVRRGFLQIDIVDDGVGGAVESGGFGLEGLRDRVEALGGRFEVDSVRGRGTRISAEIPATASPENS